MSANQILFSCPQMSELARKIVTNPMIALDWGVSSWDEFPDSSPKLFIHSVAETVEDRDVIFLASFDSSAEILRQLAVIYAFPAYGTKSLTVILPYFPGLMDRADRPGEVVMADFLARQLAGIPLSGCKSRKVVIFDIHSLQERHYFESGIGIGVRLKSAIPLLIHRIKELKLQNITIAFPDEGARKRFRDQFGEFDQIVCEKRRWGDQRIITIKEGIVLNTHVIIVDDLVMTGETMIAARNEFIKKGASSVSAYFTHATFVNDSWSRFQSAGFRNIWFTDSCPSFVNRPITVQEGTIVEVLFLAPLIVQAIKGGGQ